MVELLFDGPQRKPAARLVFAHGAGAGMQSSFMQEVARGLGARGVRVARFEFPYMQRKRAGIRTMPDRAPVLIEAWKAVVSQLGEPATLFIGGKSMGGRIASMVADELGVPGLVCVGYPFHPPRRPEQTRTAHLKELRTRCLIVQGTRDEFGTPEEVRRYDLSQSIRIVWIQDGDHSLALRRRSGHDSASALTAALDAMAAFLRAAS
jgi:predicted alpha/beta-hydrolase family hydrolase